MAFADGSTDCLARLIPSSILDCNIFVGTRPSLLLVASGLEDALIGEDEVATIADDLIHLVSQLDGLVGVLFVELVFLLRHILGLHLLLPDAVPLHDPTVLPWSDHTIWELPVKELGPILEAQVRLFVEGVLVADVVALLLRDAFKGHPLRDVQLLRVQLGRLDADPVHALTLLGEVLPDHPPDLLEGYV